MKYQDNLKENEQKLSNNFSYHKPHGDQPERYEGIRAAGASMARAIVGSTPASREQSLALTNLEEAVMWANAAIARNEKAPAENEAKAA